MYHVRWMVRRDMTAVLEIEKDSFDFPWPEEDFIKTLRQRNCIGMVAEVGEVVAGFMIYEIHKNRINVLNFAVHKDYRRKKVGTAMVERLIDKLSFQRRNRLLLEVRDSNLPAQLFFRAAGFRCVSVLRGYYEECSDDAYVFQYRYKEGSHEEPIEHKHLG